MRPPRSARQRENYHPARGKQLSLPFKGCSEEGLDDSCRPQSNRAVSSAKSHDDAGRAELSTSSLAPYDPRRSARLISALVRDTEVPPILFLGAGASYSSGIPTAATAVVRIVREAYVRNIGGGRGNPTDDECMRWLASHTWFIPGNDKRAENFPLAVKHLLKPIEFRRQVMLKLIDSTNAVSLGYQHLGRLWGDGYFQTVLTTNFDRCLLRAYQAQEGAAQVSEVHRWDGDYAQFEPSSRRRQLVWLHGNVQNYTARTTPDEVSQLSGNLVSKLRPLLDHAPLVVIGYRGAEASIMHHLLLDKNRGEMNYAKGIYWCVLRGEALHPNVEQLSAALGDNFHLLEIDGFDQLMTALAEEFVELPARTWFEAVLCRRVALASLLVKDLHSDPHFGRTKLAKLFYLIDMSGDLDFATHYSRAKNGPLDERAMYNERIGIEAMAKRHELFTTETVGRRTRYIPLNLHAMERLIAEHLGSKAAEMRSLAQRLAPMRVDQVEILTTLYACWNDLLIRRWPASDDAIITAFLDWHPAKKRFRARLPNALVWMRNQNLVPQGRDRPTEQRPPRDF